MLVEKKGAIAFAALSHFPTPRTLAGLQFLIWLVARV